MAEWLHPGLIFLLGALLIPILRGKVKSAYLISLPIFAFIDLLLTTKGVFGDIPFSTLRLKFGDYTLIFGRVDNLSLVFGYIFVIACLCMIIYALNERKDGIFMSAFIYVGSAIGVVFAGDLISLYIFWEIMAFSSLFLIWYRGTEEAHKAGFRYILWHLFGGCVLLAGIIMYAQATGSIAFNAFTWGLGWDYLPSYLILLGFSLNAAVPPIHAWLSDAYPEATYSGGVFLSAFTTKTAVYTMLRGFPGWHILIYLGAMMTIYGIIYALLENDSRRILAYSIINQVGFMIAGAGVGTPLAINGAAAHAFCHILYKGLLWMSAGSVLYMTGRTKCTDLGGLYKTMPLTTAFCMVGALSISAFPLFSGFTSKSMTIEAVAEAHLGIVWLVLIAASAGVFLHAGIKFPYFVFFAKDSGIRVRDPPLNQIVGMGIASFLCIFLGVYPVPLYAILPYHVDFTPYTLPHVVEMLSLLSFSGLAFFLCLPLLKRTQTISLDTDWLFRVLGMRFILFCERPLITFAEIIDGAFSKIADFFAWFANNPAVASRMLVALTGAIVFKPFNPLNEKYKRDLDELKRVYSDEVVHRMGIGTGVLLALIFFTLYLFIYLSYGVLWR